MDSHRPGLPRTPFTITLPEEILYEILEAYLNLPVPIPILSVLVLSKPLYNWVLPKIFHTVSVSGSQIGHIGGFSPDGWVYSTSAFSLSLVKRLDTSFVEEEFSFLPFSNLTHLFLWDSFDSEWWENQSDVMANLRLEELFAWHRADFDTLSSKLSYNTPICGTMRKLGFQGKSTMCPPQNWVQYYPNLTHIFVLCTDFQGLQPLMLTLLPTLKALKCCLIAPSWDLKATHSDVSQLVFGGDKRVSLILQPLEHIKAYGHSFWSSQSLMWKEAEARIARNPHIHEVTIIDSLST
ncbi:hypothetical protein DL96DRAFT_1652030 [Flagelloscypha sp. PMI_526]|nr:hypothetical protein DL96DRAFT_1652030 [Flagelloscypha sp. PMI_526]